MRPHHPWYRAATNSWYVEIAGQQHFLGKHPENVPPPRKRKRGDAPPQPPKEIEQAYHRLMAADPAKLPKATDLRVAVVCDLFLDFSEKHHVPDTYRSYKDFLQDFCEMYGTLLAKDLKPLHVTRWLDAHPGWKGSRRNAIIAVKRAFNWADTEGVLQPNPLKGVKKPPQRHRDRVLTPEERQEILAAIKDRHFREFVFAMMETGARPGEVRKVTTAHVKGRWAGNRPFCWTTGFGAHMSAPPEINASTTPSVTGKATSVTALVPSGNLPMTVSLLAPKQPGTLRPNSSAATDSVSGRHGSAASSCWRQPGPCGIRCRRNLTTVEVGRHTVRGWRNCWSARGSDWTGAIGIGG